MQFSFAGSDDLAAQIRQGVTPDVYAAANTSLPEELAKEGLLERPRTFATNELVVGVPAGSGIDDVSDLEDPGVTVAIGDEDVPVGAYTREVLAALGSGPAQAILGNVASSEPDVAGIVAKLNQGAVDAGFVYRSDVDASEGELTAVALPASVSPDVAYAIAATTDAAEPDLAAEFVEWRGHGGGTAHPARVRVRSAAGGRMRSSLAFRLGAGLALGLLLAFLAIPLVAIFVEAGPEELISSLGREGAAEALWLSLKTSLIALTLIVAIGTPAAYLLARRRFRGRAAVITLIELPLVLPPAAAGIALLAAFGPNGLVGGAIEDAGIRLVLETAGVVVALTFVAAPFYVRGAIAAFEAVDPRAPGRVADARGGGGEDLPARRHPRRAARAGVRVRTRLGARARRVRSDALLRRIAAGADPDRAAGDLRVPRPRLQRIAGARRRPGRRLGDAAALRQAARKGSRWARACALSWSCRSATSTSPSASRSPRGSAWRSSGPRARGSRRSCARSPA